MSRVVDDGLWSSSYCVSMCSCVERSEEVQHVSNTNHSSTLQCIGFPSLLLPSAGWNVLLRTLRTASLSPMTMVTMWQISFCDLQVQSALARFLGMERSRVRLH